METGPPMYFETTKNTLVVLTGCLLLCFQLGFAQSDEPRSMLNSDLELFGVAHPKKLAILRFSRQGQIARVLVKDGQVVKEGQFLVGLQDGIARVALEMARIEAEQEAALRTAQIELARSEEQFARTKQGFDEEVVSDFELKAKQADLDRARAAVDLERERKRQAEARLKMAEEEAKAYNLIAPFQGTVIEVHIDHGNSVGPSENAITMAQLDTLEVEMHLPIVWFGRIQVGEEYQVFAGSPVNRDILIRAEFVAPTVDSTSETVRVVFSFDNREARLPSGFEVSKLKPMRNTGPISRLDTKVFNGMQTIQESPSRLPRRTQQLDLGLPQVPSNASFNSASGPATPRR
ncbi:MAG: efflux RND transporter periplasmic adaptor subunit [Planctomycetota bacterium]